MPPSQAIASPVMKPDAGNARNRTRLAMSAGSPRRRTALWRMPRARWRSGKGLRVGVGHGHGHVGAGLGEGQADGPTDATGTAGDERDLAGEGGGIEGHGRRPQVDAPPPIPTSP